MTYQDIIHRFSTALAAVNDSQEHLLDGVITERSMKRFVIYRRNGMGVLLAVLGEDYSTVVSYIGFKNFRFLVKEFVNQRKSRSANIFAVSKSFCDHLQQTYDIHGLPELWHLARIDNLWARPKPETIQVPSGMARLYLKIQELTEARETSRMSDQERTQDRPQGRQGTQEILRAAKFQVDYSCMEMLQVVVCGEEKHLKLYA